MDWRYHLLKRTGYSFPTKETAGKTLEFLGTSGVGKSTIFNKSVARLKNRWLFAYHLGFLKRKSPPSEVDKALMDILMSRIATIKNSDSFCPWHSLIDLQLSVRIMHETMQVLHDVFPKGIAFDEGFFRHFAAEILQLGDDFPDQVWKNRAFVYLRTQKPETILLRHKARWMASATRGERQRVKTDDQILSEITHEQEMFQIIADRALSFGCPVLIVDAENPVEESVKKILDFEKSLGQQFSSQQKMESNPQLSA